MDKLDDLFEIALKDWHNDAYIVRRKSNPTDGVYLWNVVNRETGAICRLFFDSHIDNWDCGGCRRRDMVDGHCLHSLLVRIDTYITTYEKECSDESRRAVIAAAVEAVREKIGIADADEYRHAHPEQDDVDPAADDLLHDEDLYIEAVETIIPWQGPFYGMSLLELTETPEGCAFLQELMEREPDDDADDLRRHVDELIRDTAERLHAAIRSTHAKDRRRAAAA